MKKLISRGVMAMPQAPLSFTMEAVSAFHGTISRIDFAAWTIIVKTADGTEQTLHFTTKTAVHGTEATTGDTFHELKEGTEVVAHYSTKETEKTAVEVDKIGKDGMKAVEGTIIELDRRGKKLAVKSADGTEQTFKLADRAAVDAAKGLDNAAEKLTKVTIYYTEDADRKVAHFFEKQ